MTCLQVRADIAASLLAGDEPDEAASAHVRVCDDCALEVAQLRAVVALLPLAAPKAASSATGDDLALRRLLRAASSQTRRQRSRSWLLGVAAAAALAVAVGTAAVTVTHHPADLSRTTISATDPVSGVHGTLRVTPAGSGSSLTLAVDGVTSGTQCNLVVVDGSGRRRVVSTWTAGYNGTASVQAASELTPSQIQAVELTDASTGNTLLRLTG